MRDLNKSFVNKSINYEKLLEYGFYKNDNCYTYEINIHDDNFKAVIEISESKQTSKIIDLFSNEEYVLVDIKGTTGKFVGSVKEEYELLLKDIIEKCTTSNVFKNNQTQSVIKYIKEKYNDDLEYLWEKSPNTAIWRNKNNNKWYGLVTVLSEKKLGIESDKIVDIIDLRYPKDKIKEIIDNKKVFKGYHMNKNNWITIRLDESMDIKEIYKIIDNSYEISLKK